MKGLQKNGITNRDSLKSISLSEVSSETIPTGNHTTNGTGTSAFVNTVQSIKSIKNNLNKSQDDLKSSPVNKQNGAQKSSAKQIRTLHNVTTKIKSDNKVHNKPTRMPALSKRVSTLVAARNVIQAAQFIQSYNQPEEKQISELECQVLSGSVKNLPPVSSNVIRVFISSTFSGW